MNNVKQSFQNYITEKKLCESADKILLTVSGGMDSMVMLHLFQECGFSIGVAHANFQLREEESDEDEKFVQTFCHQHSLRFFTKKFETESYAIQHHLSIQMAARKLRYEWFNEIISSHHFDWFATAHHLNDSLETVLLNLVRGSGLEGFDGIAEKNGKAIRPMLFATRDTIEAYAKEKNILWREDRSNGSDDYPRNFIRHHVLPLLKELNPSLENSFSESISKISGAVELLELGYVSWKEKFETKKGEQVLWMKDGFRHLKNPESVLWNLIKDLGFNFDQCHQIMASIHGQSGKKFFSSSFVVTIDREFIILSKLQHEIGEVLIEQGQTEATLGIHTLKIEDKTITNFKSNPKIATLDRGKLKFPLRWRKWKAGDSFYPLGMNHKKKLSDFLIDEKISLADKELVSVLESAGEIVWVVGMRLDDRYKIDEATKSTVICRLSTVDT